MQFQSVKVNVTCTNSIIHRWIPVHVRRAGRVLTVQYQSVHVEIYLSVSMVVFVLMTFSVNVLTAGLESIVEPLVSGTIFCYVQRDLVITAVTVPVSRLLYT